MNAGQSDVPAPGVNERDDAAVGDVNNLSDTSEAGRGRSVSEAAACLAGVSSSNTPPQNSNLDHFTGSEDWFEWNAYVLWPPEIWTVLKARLDAAKNSAQDSEKCRASNADIIDFGGCPGLVSPAGAHRGKKARGAYTAYCLKVSGLDVHLANRPTPAGVMPNAYFRADGLQCLEFGASERLQRGRELISKAGGIIHLEKLSRVDLCLDLPAVPIDEFKAAFLEKRYICLAKRRGYDESPGITLKWGKRPLYLRIYDKKAELMAHPDPIKIELMDKRRWGGIPESATRVEFEVCREALTTRGIDSPDDYYAKRADLAAHLCNDWFRMTAGEVDRANTTRAENHPLWEEVKSGFLSWAGSPTGQPLDPLDRGSIDARQLRRQAVGVLITAAVMQGLPFLTNENFEDFVALQVRRELREINLPAEWTRRAIRLQPPHDGNSNHWKL